MRPFASVETPVRPEIDFGAAQDEDLLSDTPWNVVLLDDDHHTYQYVVEMLMEIFGYSEEKAFQMTVEVDTRKRVIVWSGHLERAEAYLEAIHDYGPDWRMESSLGSMSARLEKAR
ncbi:MAG TPA: ATP-dependent Clp protease adaptor ClpS [Abditibacterium sp.]|jgi:ATP-dependent Clp protease adaptor protein ClpS